MSVIAKFRGGGKTAEAGPNTQAHEKSASELPPLSPMDRAAKVRRITPARIAGVLAAVGALGVGGYAYARYGLEKSLSVAEDRLTISTVQQAPFRDYVPVTGSVTPKDTVFLDTVEGGQVTEVLVEDGALVEAGQPLARLKNTRLELEVLGREAQLTEQQSYLANARLAFQQSEMRNRRDMLAVEREIDRLSDDLKRKKPLEGDGFSIQAIREIEAQLEHRRAERETIEQSAAAERQVARQNLAQLEQSIARMTQSLALVRQNLDNLNVTAPISGQVTGFDLKVGEVVSSGQRIGQVDTIDAYKVTAMVDEFYLGRVAYGQPGSVEMGGAEHALKVSKVYPDVRERQFAVDLDFVGDAPEGMRRGQTLRPRIELGETARSLLVANGPFYDETGGLWVLAVSRDGGSASRRDVTLGRRNPESVEVISGLAAGDRVITSSYQSFKDVDRIDLR